MRTGKIARLPRATRDQLNHRLADGEIGAKLVSWLNTLPEVQKVLLEDFGGRPITEQNLSEWRQGGFEDWLRHEDARAWAAQIVEESDDLENDSGHVPLYDRAAYPALLAICGLIHSVRVSPDPIEQRRSVISAAQQLTNLRRACHHAEKLRLERERWEFAKEQARERAAHRAELQRLDRERLELLQAEAQRDAEMRATVLSDLPFDQIVLSDAKHPAPRPDEAPQSRISPSETPRSQTSTGETRRSRKRVAGDQPPRRCHPELVESRGFARRPRRKGGKPACSSASDAPPKPATQKPKPRPQKNSVNHRPVTAHPSGQRKPAQRRCRTNRPAHSATRQRSTSITTTNTTARRRLATPHPTRSNRIRPNRTSKLSSNARLPVDTYQPRTAHRLRTRGGKRSPEH